MFEALISRVVCHMIGYAYPAYMTCVAVHSKDFSAHTQWLTFWIVQTYFRIVETLMDFFFSGWIPFYYTMKVILLLWLVSPHFTGARKIYHMFIMPQLLKYEHEIDEQVARIHSRSKEHIEDMRIASLKHIRNQSSEVIKSSVAQIVASCVEQEMNQHLENAMKEEEQKEETEDTNVTTSHDSSHVKKKTVRVTIPMMRKLGKSIVKANSNS